MREFLFILLGVVFFTNVDLKYGWFLFFIGLWLFLIELAIAKDKNR